ncbi:hypothetical protein ACT009_08585 [Sphingomonas sp. Tas61C01]|uniref:hypothetical protein n=1 Tax=Sphingomonas sp. Tas61C01 TaxID=3458297 RepID=UPI00403E512A
MNLEDRSRIIINKVRNLDPRFGRRADKIYTDVHRDARFITDQPATWDALIVPEYTSKSSAGQTPSPSDQPWDLFRLWAYDQPRMTVHMRGENVNVTLYMTGAWEKLFFVGILPELPPIVPGGQAGIFGGTAW